MPLLSRADLEPPHMCSPHHRWAPHNRHLKVPSWMPLGAAKSWANPLRGSWEPHPDAGPAAAPPRESRHPLGSPGPYTPSKGPSENAAPAIQRADGVLTQTPTRGMVRVSRRRASSMRRAESTHTAVWEDSAAFMLLNQNKIPGESSLQSLKEKQAANWEGSRKDHSVFVYVRSSRLGGVL